jgi:hypothetical protein
MLIAESEIHLVNMPPIFTRVIDPLPHNIHGHLILMTARQYAKAC